MNDHELTVQALLAQNEKLKSHLSRLGVIAQNAGFTGSSGAEMVEFVKLRFDMAKNSTNQIAAIERAIGKLDPSANSLNLPFIVENAVNKINAQRTTIEVLFGESVARREKINP